MDCQNTLLLWDRELNDILYQSFEHKYSTENYGFQAIQYIRCVEIKSRIELIQNLRKN